MKLKALFNCKIDGKAVFRGDVVEVEKEDSNIRYAIASGLAQVVTEEEKPTKAKAKK